jgi:hypothetical protein
MTDDTLFRPIIRTQADLEQTWRRLMEPLGFGGHSVWMLLIGPDDRPVPTITEITEAHDPPDDESFAGFTALVEHLAEEFPGTRFAFLRTRPGRDGVTAADRTWAEGLTAAARSAGVTTEVVHRANDVDLVPLPLDDLIPVSA